MSNVYIVFLDQVERHLEMCTTKSIVAGGLRKRLPMKPCLFCGFFLLLAFLALPQGAYALQLENVYVDRFDFDIVEKQVLAVYIKPVLGYVSVECKPLDYGNPFDLSVSSNYTDPVFGKITGIWLQPEAHGRYNLTITFRSDETWDYRLGVYPRNWAVSGTRLSGNWTINVLVNSHRDAQSPEPFFFIELPAPVNSLLFMTIVGFIGYLNVFLFLDTYFKSKKEIISNKRWLFVGLAGIASGWAIYQFYNFAAFVLPPFG